MCRTRGWMFALLFGTAVGVAQAQSPSPITIKTIEGDHAINSIRMKRGHDPVVQVLSGSGEPIAGATVSFLLPASGAGATFSGGGRLTTIIDGPMSSAFIQANSPRAFDGLLSYIIFAANEETRAGRIRAGLGTSDDANLPTCN